MKRGVIIGVLLLLGGVAALAFREGEGFEGKVVERYRLFVGGFPHEKLYVHTDREAYEVRDTVWFRVYGVHALTNVPGVPSRFVYVDLEDKRDSLVERVKVGMRDTCYYENGEKVYMLDEVKVKRKRQPKYYSFYDPFATLRRDSTRIAAMAEHCADFYQLLEMIPGVTVELWEGRDTILRYGKGMRVLVNDFEENVSVLRFMPLGMVWNISVIDPYMAERLFLGSAKGGGGLLIEADPKFYPVIMAMRQGRVNLSEFTLLGYQEPASFTCRSTRWIRCGGILRQTGGARCTGNRWCG